MLLPLLQLLFLPLMLLCKKGKEAQIERRSNVVGKSSSPFDWIGGK
jgi:hypothetical protein